MPLLRNRVGVCPPQHDAAVAVGLPGSANIVLSDPRPACLSTSLRRRLLASIVQSEPHQCPNPPFGDWLQIDHLRNITISRTGKSAVSALTTAGLSVNVAEHPTRK